MTAHDVFAEARASLVAHRLRASLAALGILCGIAAVIAALAISTGARRQALDELGSLGLDNIYVRAERPAGASTAPDARRAPPVPMLTIDDGNAVAARLGAIDAVAPVRFAPLEINGGAPAADAYLAGVSVDWRRVVGADQPRGRWLREEDETQAARVAVIGHELGRELFGPRDAIGQYLRAGEAWFRVVGVFEPRSRGGVAGQAIDPARAAFVPVAAMDVRRGPGDSLRHVSELIFRVRPGADVAGAARAIDAALRERYTDGAEFSIVVPRALLDARLRAQRAMRALLAGIGGLALIISGVGIMNIMLASVVERTQEIGVRRAFGATRVQIVRQFTVEAVLLCVAGGAAGIPAGALLAWAVAISGGWPVAIAPSSVILAVGLAAGVGLGSGIYPARRAASLDPAAALRED